MWRRFHEKNRPVLCRMKMEKFEGNGEPFDEYIRRFETCADLNGWYYGDMGRLLSGHLKGQADLSTANEVRRDYKTLRDFLLQRYGIAGKEAYYRGLAEARVQTPEESIQDFYNDYTTLVQKATGIAAEQQLDQRESIRKFLKKLRDAQVAYDVHKEKPRTITDAVNMAISIQAGLDDFMSSSVAQSKSARSRQVTAGVMRAQGIEVRAAVTQTVAPVSDRPVRFCTHCKRNGHLMEECCSRLAGRPAYEGMRRANDRLYRKPGKPNDGKCWNCDELGHR